MFATQAFAYIGKLESAGESIAFLRTKYQVEEGREIDVRTADVGLERTSS